MVGMSDDIKYAVMPSRTRFDRKPSYFGRGEKVFAGYDVFEIAGHNAEGAQVFLWLKPVGWSRTLEGVQDVMQERSVDHGGFVSSVP
jgi:hypothetical protein